MPWSAAFLRLESVAALTLLAVLVLPVLLYLWSGWPVRRAEIFGTMSDRAVRLYFRQFFPAQTLPARHPTEAFRRHYHRRYGRQHFIVPILLMVAVAAVSLGLAVRTAVGWLAGGAHPTGLPPIAVAAVAGAYMWVATDVISRCRGRALAPVDLYWSALRFIIAIPVGFAFAGIFKDEAGAPLAFVLGAFPTRTLITVIRRIAARRLGLSETGEGAQSELEKLQGISTGNAERFSDEGVSTILQLAYADPVDLTIRTSFAFNYVVDCVSQALAWIYFEGSLAKLRACSLRGGYEIYTVISDLDGDDPAAAKTARATIDCVAAEVGQKPVVFETTLRQIAEDPYTEFNYAIWNVADDE
jgi:hypothetical protein